LAVAVEVLDVSRAPTLPADTLLTTSRTTVELHPARPISISDVAVALAFGLLAGLVVWNVQRSMDARFFIAPHGNDVSFEADLPTVADTVLHR
jgi:hypothetical protein